MSFDVKYYENTDNSFNVRLPQILSSENVVEVKYNNFALGFHMLNADGKTTANLIDRNETQDERHNLLVKADAATDIIKQTRNLEGFVCK